MGRWSPSSRPLRALAIAAGCLLTGPAPAQPLSPMTPITDAPPSPTTPAIGMPASGGQVLRFAVAVPSGPAWSSIWVEINRLGRSTALGLVDDGSSPEDIPLDGVFVGSQAGDALRTLVTWRRPCPWRSCSVVVPRSPAGPRCPYEITGTLTGAPGGPASTLTSA